MNTAQRTVAPLAEACMAKRSLRFAEYLIDSVILTIVMFFAKRLAGNAMNVNGILATAQTQEETLSLLAAVLPKLLAVSLLLENAIAVLYYFVCEAFFHGKTIGKSACGLRTVTIDGKQPSVGAIALRSICRLIPFSMFSVLFGNYWRAGKIRGNWYDRLSGTYVIKDSLVKKYEELVKSTEFETRYSRRIADRKVYDRTETDEPAAEAEVAKAPEAPQAALAEGDKVVFRYGASQPMRVGEIRPDGTVSCYTFDESGARVEAGDFPARYLDKVSD